MTTRPPIRNRLRSRAPGLPRRVRVWAVACAVLLPYLTVSGVGATEDAQVLRDEMAATDRELSAADARLRVAIDALTELDQRAAEVASDLVETEARLSAAKAAAASSSVIARDAIEAATTGGALQQQRAEQMVADSELADRAVWLWKHGPAARADMQLRLAGGARSTHDLALSQRIVDGVVEASSDAATAAALHLAQIVAARDVSVRDEARRALFLVRSELSDVTLLQRHQASLARQLQDVRLEQTAIVDGLRGDRDALSALARQLRRTLAQISLAGALVPPADLPLDGPPPPWVDQLPAAGRNWAVAIDAIAIRHGLDGALFTALVWSESGFQAAAVSHAGAIGLSQLMPATAAGLGVDPWNPYENLSGGARYLRAQIERFGAADLGLAAYNAGPGRVERSGNQIPDIVETQIYVVRVLERWELLRQA